MIIKQHNGWLLWNRGCHPEHCEPKTEHSTYHLCSPEKNHSCDSFDNLQDALRSFEQQSGAEPFVIGKTNW